MMKRLFLIIAFWAAGVAGASAQMRLTLPQALDLALSENPTVKVAEMEVQRYDYVKRQTWGNLLPQISASGSYTRSIVKSEMRGGISFGADNTFAVQGDLSLPLFAPSVYRTLKMNDAQMATAVEAARASRIDLTAEVKKAFYNILLAEQSLAVLRESEATVQRTVDDTQVQYKHGLASGIRPADRAGAVEQPQAHDPPDREFDQAGQADAQDVPLDSRGRGDRGGGRAGRPARRRAGRDGRADHRRDGQLRPAFARIAGGGSPAFAQGGQCGTHADARSLRVGLLYG